MQQVLKGNGKSIDRKKSWGFRLHSNTYAFTQGEDGSCNGISGNEGTMDVKHPADSHILVEPEVTLPLVTVPPHEFNKENGVVWSSSPARLELPPPKPFDHSNCSGLPCPGNTKAKATVKEKGQYDT